MINLKMGKRDLATTLARKEKILMMMVLAMTKMMISRVIPVMKIYIPVHHHQF